MAAWSKGDDANESRGDAVVDVRDGGESPGAAESGRVAVAEFQGLVAAGAGARGDECQANAAIGQGNLGFHRGVAARVECFAGGDGGDGGFRHQDSPLRGCEN